MVVYFDAEDVLIALQEWFPRRIANSSEKDKNIQDLVIEDISFIMKIQKISYNWKKL